jgi:hypothetical protein
MFPSYTLLVLFFIYFLNEYGTLSWRKVTGVTMKQTKKRKIVPGFIIKVDSFLGDVWLENLKIGHVYFYQGE